MTQTRTENAAGNPTRQMLEEFLLEINTSEGHIVVRCTSLETAREWCRRLFPKSYVHDGPDANIHLVYFNETETNPNEAQGTITRMVIPNKWVQNRRLQDQDKKKAERAA